MEEITELDMTRYLVLKQADIDAELSPGQKTNLESIKRVIGERRVKRGKPYSSGYLVLNLDDEFDGDYLFKKLNRIIPLYTNLKIKDIAVALVNAILKAKIGDKNE